MSERRLLIVNADDFGLSPGVNRGIVEAHEQGIVTSASLMVRWAGAQEAGAYLRAHVSLDAGLHLDLGEWAYREGEWVPVYHVVPIDDEGAVRAEAARQLDAFRHLTGNDPTHLDTHQHVHQREPARAIVVELGNRLGVPVRHFTPGIRYCGEFYGQTTEGEPLSAAITEESLLRILARIGPGVTELACHPGCADDVETMYRAERARELLVLRSPLVKAAVAELGIELCSFRQVVGSRSGAPGVAQPSAMPGQSK